MNAVGSLPPVPSRADDERLRTAVHEAAHFVVAELYPCPDLEVHAISVLERGPFAGGLVASAADELDRAGIRSLAAVLLAGFEAEWLLAGSPSFPNAITDLRQVYVLLAHLSRHDGTPIESVWRDIQGRVRRLLERHWGGVSSVARELLREGIVTAEEARVRLRRHVPAHTQYRDGEPIPPPIPRRPEPHETSPHTARSGVNPPPLRMRSNSRPIPIARAFR